MNEGAGRGFILIAVAVLVGAVLLGKGLDDTSPRVSTDDGGASSDTTTPEDSEDGGTGDTVSSPVDPSTINVVVANGSGVSGAAGAISEDLAALGYPPPLATDAFAEADTPLDTVYFATNPDSSAQAMQVAADLALPDTSVLPYPPEGAPADIGLAQVLVVLGSSPGMLATAGAGTTPTTVAG
jgi:hypothetical protein